MSGRIQPPGPDGRAVVEVALGVAIDRERGRFLMGSRPAGKPYAGWWEFPGGKLEAGETPQACLRREFAEELGLTVGRADPWFVLEHSYPHAYVRLHYHRIWSWTGSECAREGQSLAWFDLGVCDNTRLMLPMNALVIERAALPGVLAVVAGTRSVDRRALAASGAGGLAAMPQVAHEAGVQQLLADLSATTGLPVVRAQTQVAQAAQAADASLQDALLVLAAPGVPAREILQPQTQRAPLFVEGAPGDLDSWQRLGAHGVYVRF